MSLAYSWVFLLLPVPWLLRAILPPVRQGRVAVRVPFGTRLDESTGGGATESASPLSTNRSWGKIVMWTLLVIATARPQWIEPPISRNLPTRDLLLLVDLSGSMQQADFVNSAGETIDRLTAVKEVLGEFLERREGDRVGLVVFGDSAYLQAPFSSDLTLARRLLDETEIGMAGPRTALGDAIGLGIHLFEQSTAPARTIIALTDGNDTSSQIPPIEAARIAAQNDIRIHTVAIGDPTTVGEEVLDEQALREVAIATGGSYFFAADRIGLEGIYSELDQIETRELQTISHRPRRDLFHWVVAAALLISLGQILAMTIRNRQQRKLTDRQSSVRVDPRTGQLEVIQ